MMSNPVSKLFLAAIFIYLLTISAVWADRILIDDAEQTVAVSNNYSCYRPVGITVDTVNPDLYDTHSPQLQKLGDSVKAMLTYECPGLNSIQLTGLIRGLDDIVYQGEMLKNNNWLVRPLVSERQDEADQSASSSSGQIPVAKRYDDELKHGQLEVTGLHLGMGVEQVRDIVFNTFGVAPQYDAEKGLMTMNDGYCPEAPGLTHSDAEVSTASRCFQAWFSDNRVARLQRLTLFQVVDAQVQQVNRLLVEKYGNPLQTNSAADNTPTQMIWRAIHADPERSEIQEIDAVITAIDKNLVSTNVALYATAPVDELDQNYADLDLKL